METRLKTFNQRFALHEACTTRDPLRPIMAFVYFKNGYAYASDAHIAIKASLKDITTLDDEDITRLNGTMIHCDLFKQVLKQPLAEVRDGYIVCSSLGNEVRFKLRTDIKSLNFEAVFNNSNDAEPIDAIGIKPKLLSRICSAMGVGDTMRLDFHGSSDRVFLSDVLDPKDITGLIMPVRVNDPEFDFK